MRTPCCRHSFPLICFRVDISQQKHYNWLPKAMQLHPKSSAITRYFQCYCNYSDTELVAELICKEELAEGFNEIKNYGKGQRSGVINRLRANKKRDIEHHLNTSFYAFEVENIRSVYFFFRFLYLILEFFFFFQLAFEIDKSVLSMRKSYVLKRFISKYSFRYYLYCL